MNRERLALFAAGVVLAVGCGQGDPDVVTIDGTATQLRLSTLSELYTAFAEQRRRPPAEFGEMQAFGAALSPSLGGPINVTPEFLVSTRDKEPFVIRYKMPVKPKPASLAVAPDGPVVAHEKTGVGGRRFVVFGGSHRIGQVDEAKFQELVR